MPNGGYNMGTKTRRIRLTTIMNNPPPFRWPSYALCDREITRDGELIDPLHELLDLSRRLTIAEELLRVELGHDNPISIGEEIQRDRIKRLENNHLAILATLERIEASLSEVRSHLGC
jgi:hypothetical protein